MKSECAETMWKCERCDKQFKYESEKRRHEQSHVPQFECKVCSKKFSFQSALRRHEKQHDRNGSVLCKDCGKNFKDEILLKRHMQYAHKGTHKCANCSATFHSELALRTHIKTHKPESERQYRCSYDGCNKTFNFPHHLKHHELTHSDEKQYFCKECGKGFIQSHHLKIHQRVHEPDSWLSCSVPSCNKKFSSEYALKRHKATHKNKTDHAISTKNNKHTGGASVKEMMLCRNCNQLFTRRLYKKHAQSCTLEDNKDFFETSLQNLQICEEVIRADIKFDLDKLEAAEKIVIDNDIDTVENFESTLHDCKSTLGSCIVTGRDEISDNCLCAQITDTVGAKDNYGNEVPMNDNDSIKITINDKACLKKRQMDANACETCECANICELKYNEIKNEMPELEYRDDGIVKIKETFDMDIEVASTVEEIRNVEASVEINFFKPEMNTCRDVLGKCIVSGNGTIGEGCLCAKMTADDQQMIAQEIEDITPCPKNTWMTPKL